MKFQGRPVDILLVEDSVGDVRLTEEMLKKSKVEHNLIVAESGEEALAYLRKKGQHTDAPSPDFVFLDLTLPKKKRLRGPDRDESR